jgi:hypothetical protein
VKQIRFGEKGKYGVKLVDVELPHEERGIVTQMLYLWRENGWPVWIDARDLPTLAKKLGWEHLEGNGLDEMKERRGRSKRKKVEADVQEVAEIEASDEDGAEEDQEDTDIDTMEVSDA